MDSDESMGDEVYHQPDDADEREDTGILDPEDTLSERDADPYEEGYSPPERPYAVEDHGTTAREQREGESLDQRLAEEVPDPTLDDVAPGDGIGDLPGGDGEVAGGDQVGRERSGRLVAPDEGAHGDDEKDVVATDVGIDGAAASAEEAAMHTVPDDEDEIPR
ncbi:DUF5709 domain-containing protein [Streptomyces sp. NPDC047097]|uniref:DUF5709 domain-containing protein n=1 Tax=Streptomyces sp. NPDC047097 TaxID=3155260 RepID=UPI0033DD15EB